MPGSSKAKVKSWTQGLDKDDVREAMIEACVDANGEDEQHAGLLAAIEDELQFPFQAMVLGEKIAVVDMEWPRDDEYGLDLVCERNGERHCVEARSVQVIEPFPKGHLFLAAYLEWKRTL